LRANGSKRQVWQTEPWSRPDHSSRRYPGEGDLYVLEHVAHDWHDEAAKAVLRRVRAAMSPE
jgi:hypothetical protein